jgi:hypothetical protein
MNFNAPDDAKKHGGVSKQVSKPSRSKHSAFKVDLDFEKILDLCVQLRTHDVMTRECCAQYNSALSLCNIGPGTIEHMSIQTK